MHRKLIFSLSILSAGSLHGCVAPHAQAGANADASISAVRASVDHVRAALVELRSDIRAGRDVNTNDKWTLRLLGLGVLLLGLSYPLGKIVWLTSAALRKKAQWVMIAASRARAIVAGRDWKEPDHAS